MPDRLITHLRHVDLAVPDYARQREFYAGVWGLTEVAGDTGISFLAAEGSPEQYIVRLRKAEEKRLDLVSFGAASAADVDALAERLGAAGVRMVGEPGKLATPGGGYGFRFFDIDGRTVEVSSDVAVRPRRRLEEREAVPVRLSHVVLNSPDLGATRVWYERHLDFALSDTLASQHTSLHHISFEMRGLDEYMYGTGRLLRAGVRMIWGPGRHKARRNGLVDGDRLLPFPTGTDLLDVAVSGDAPPTGEAVALRDVRLLPPIVPASVRDFVSFEEHVEGVRRAVSGEAGVPDAWYDAPAFYFSNPHAMVGAHDDVPVPPGCAALDFELEVAAVIGRAGADLTPAQARDRIAAYTIFNDWSARDLQSREMRVGLGPCKGKDFATTLGPWLVTADELEPRRDADGFLRLALTAEVNGEVVGRDLLSNMGWPFEELAAYASRGAALRPGDTVTLTVEGIGTVSNTVVSGRPPVPLPRARRRSRERP